MTTEQLIARLARQAGPVQVMAPLAARWTHWLLVAAASSTVALGIVGLRADVAARVLSADFLLRATITAAIAVTAARHALRWTVPGAEPEGGRRWWALLLLALWAIVLAAPLTGPAFSTTLSAVRWHPACAWQIGAISALPAIWLFRQARRAAPYDLAWASVQAALAAAATGALAVQWSCGLDDRAHHLAWHLVPVVVVSLVVAQVGRLALHRH